MPWFGRSDARKELEAKLKEYIPQHDRKKAFRNYSIRCDGIKVSVSIQVRRPMNGDDISNVVTFFRGQLGEEPPVNLDEVHQDKSGLFGHWNPWGEITDARMAGRHDYLIDYGSVTGMLTFQLTGKPESKICDVYLQVSSSQVTVPTGDAEHDLAPLLKALSAYAGGEQ
jgi:hypothetical protein